MKRVKIPAWYRGLVYENNRYTRTLKEGTHWLWKGDVTIFQMNQLITTSHDIRMLLEDEALAEELCLLEVKDSQIALQYENGIFKKVITPGSYGYWKGMVDYEFIIADLNKTEITEPIDRAVLNRPELALYVRSFCVEPNEQAIVFVDGKNAGVAAPGVYNYWKNTIPIQLVRCDMRQQQIEISGQEMLTRDKAAIRLNFEALYRVKNLEQAVTQNKEFGKQLYTVLQLSLRACTSSYTLDELLEKRNELSAQVYEAAGKQVAQLGIELEGCGIKDIILPGDVKEIMNKVLIAEKKAQANIIMRREETASTRSLLNTAKLMEDNEMLLRLKEMEYVEKIADKIGSLSVSNGGRLTEQLKELFVPQTK